MITARPPRAFRATGAVVLLVLCTLMAAAMLIDAATRTSLAETALLAPWPLLVLWVVYVAGLASDVRADLTGVRVQNLLRRTWLPWGRVRSIGMRWQLELTLDDGSRLTCFGGPARSRPRRLGPGGAKEDGDAQAEDGIAALHRLRSQAEHEADAVVVRGWDWPMLLTGIVLAAWAVIAVVLTR